MYVRLPIVSVLPTPRISVGIQLGFPVVRIKVRLDPNLGFSVTYPAKLEGVRPVGILCFRLVTYQFIPVLGIKQVVYISYGFSLIIPGSPIKEISD